MVEKKTLLGRHRPSLDMPKRKPDTGPLWARFLDGLDLESLPFKRVQKLVKQARLPANGGREACVQRLKEFILLPEPGPAWFVEEQTKAAKLVFLAEGQVKCTLRVGERIEIQGQVGKCSGRTARIAASDPADCIEETTRPKHITFGNHKVGRP